MTPDASISVKSIRGSRPNMSRNGAPLMSSVSQVVPFDPIILVEVDITPQVPFQNTVEAFSLTVVL
jgi:hypothetical protein